MIGKLGSASSFPAALGPRLDDLVARFNGDGVFPVFILLNDGRGGFAFYRWKHFDADLEELAASEITWPGVSLTVIAADGRGQCQQIEERRGWLQ